MPSFFFENLNKEIEKYNSDKKRRHRKQLANYELDKLSNTLKNYCAAALHLLEIYQEENPNEPKAIDDLVRVIKSTKKKIQSGNMPYLFDVEEDLQAFNEGMKAMHNSASPLCNGIANLCALICLSGVAVMLVQGIMLPVFIGSLTLGFASQLFTYLADSAAIPRALEEPILAIAKTESKLTLDGEMKLNPAPESNDDSFHVSVNPQIPFPKSFTPFVFPFAPKHNESQPRFNVSVSPKAQDPQNCPPLDVSVSPQVQAPQGYPPFTVSVSPKEQIPQATIEPARSPRYFANNRPNNEESFQASVEPQQGYANHS